MKTTLLIAIYLLFVSLGLQGFEVNWPAKLSVTIDQSFENVPINGTIQVIHTKSQAVDQTSFTLNGKSFSPQFQGDEKPPEGGDEVIISRYSFTVSPQAKGLYVFPSVSARVGDTVVSSSPISYEVIGTSTSQELTLSARVEEKGPFYPGQKVTFEYRILFRQPIQLTKEELPLLNMDGFRNVGATEATDGQEGDFSVQILSQKAVAESIGDFHSGPSIIEGFVYYVDSTGTPRQMSGIYAAQAPDVTVTVLPFPKEGKPASFNGALGVFHWQVRTLGSTSVDAGEKIQLEIFVSGSGDLETVHVPDLSIQKPFKDGFLFNDLAPIGTIKEGTKRFVLEVRPLSANIREIPSITFSSFDPISKTYVVTKSSPLPITVRQSGKKLPREVSEQGSIEIQSNEIMQTSEAETKDYKSILLLYGVLSVIVLLGIQLLIKGLSAESQEKASKGHELFLEAIKARSKPDKACKLLTDALLAALFEAGCTKERILHPEQLKQEGLEGDVRGLLVAIQKKRFTGLEAQVEMNEIITEATQLYHRIRNV